MHRVWRNRTKSEGSNATGASRLRVFRPRPVTHVTLTFTRKPSYYVPAASTHKTGSDESAAQQPPQSKEGKKTHTPASQISICACSTWRHIYWQTYFKEHIQALQKQVSVQVLGAEGRLMEDERTCGNVANQTVSVLANHANSWRT